MTTVYVVTEGDYSDYRICGVFSTRAMADDYVRGGYGDSVEEYEVDPEYVALPPGYHLFTVSMLRDGTLPAPYPGAWDNGAVHLAHYANASKVGEIELCPPRRVQAVGGGWVWKDGCMRATVAARDTEHAVKIVGEWRATILAMDLWPPDLAHLRVVVMRGGEVDVTDHR